MHNFNEDLLQFIWRHRLLLPHPLVTVQGHQVTVISPGELNRDAGPDFFNARIKISGVMLAGNIEVHIRTSDWLRHHHQYDKSYDNIILHVVFEHDAALSQNMDNNVEVLELRHLVADETIKMYEKLAGATEKLPCSGQLKNVNDLKFTAWLERMAVERLEEKMRRIQTLFDGCSGDYVQTFYTLLLRNFGFKVNSVPFEMIARQLPGSLLFKHSDNLQQLEALLLGMAGMLDGQKKDQYIIQLQNEFEFLKSKYALTPLPDNIFKFSKLRPANFPGLRLVQFAALVHNNSRLFSSPHSAIDHGSIMLALSVKLTGYWKEHYLADGRVTSRDLSMGSQSAENIIINTMAPFLFFYSRKLSKPAYGDAALDLLAACKMESNIKTRLFAVKSSSLKSAHASQAVINLYDNYCSTRQCLKCGVAASLLQPTA
jgi:hypothetical protein